jgi:hypothetical protein
LTGCHRLDDADEVEARNRISLWRALAKLLLLVPPPDPSASRAPLPEDWQLREFAPLLAAHQRLDFHMSRQPDQVRAVLLGSSLCLCSGIATTMHSLHSSSGMEAVVCSWRDLFMKQ